MAEPGAGGRHDSVVGHCADSDEDPVGQPLATRDDQVNGYGPTECTVTCLRADIVAGQPIAIGRPVPGMRAWALDEHLRLVPDGQPGELCMGGAGLAVGYLGLPELNATKFPEHPTLGRIYRTGDLVHKGPDGLFYYHGRIDSQVKLRGYRIELEAIESCVARHPGVREAACRVQGEGASEALAAHIVPANPAAPPHAEELKAHLKAHLPVYMIPSVFATSRELPRNAGGKLRRTHLPVVVANRPSRPTHTVTAPGPENPVQELIGRATQEVLQLADPPSIDEDFFTDIGGSSLQAAMLITALRADPGTASITVRDLYECRTVRALAQRAEPPDTRTQATPLGDLTGVRTQYERALQISEAALGPDHPTIGTWFGECRGGRAEASHRGTAR